MDVCLSLCENTLRLFLRLYKTIGKVAKESALVSAFVTPSSSYLK